MVYNNAETDDIKEFNEQCAKAEPETNTTGKLRSNDTVKEMPQQEDESGSVDSSSSKMWAMHGGYLFTPCDEAIKELPAGQYTVKMSQSLGIHFSRHPVSLDDLLIMPDSASEEIIKGIEDFWNKEQRFRDFGFLWKRGVMLFGPAGSGKTSTLQILSQKIIEKDGIAVYVNDPEITAKGLELLRRIEPARPMIVMIEDIDAVIRDHGESDVLAMLDGELQVDNVVFIATTNYPERLDKRLINRPSRFDVVRKIGMPSAKARKQYLMEKNYRLKNNPEELSVWVNKTKGFSIAHMKELIISVEVFDYSVDQATERLRAMMDYHPSSDDLEEGNFGFVDND